MSEKPYGELFGVKVTEVDSVPEKRLSKAKARNNAVAEFLEEFRDSDAEVLHIGYGSVFETRSMVNRLRHVIKSKGIDGVRVASRENDIYIVKTEE